MLIISYIVLDIGCIPPNFSGLAGREISIFSFFYLLSSSSLIKKFFQFLILFSISFLAKFNFLPITARSSFSKSDNFFIKAVKSPLFTKYLTLSSSKASKFKFLSRSLDTNCLISWVFLRISFILLSRV